MSLVGPRPEMSGLIDTFSESIPHYLARQRVKSGMTGWAQVNGLRGNTSLEDRVNYDRYYIENWSLTLDVKIILRTLWAIRKAHGSFCLFRKIPPHKGPCASFIIAMPTLADKEFAPIRNASNLIDSFQPLVSELNVIYWKIPSSRPAIAQNGRGAIKPATSYISPSRITPGT